MSDCTVTIPRAQHEALTGALERCCEVMRQCPPNCTVGQWFAAVDQALAALRAAGIDLEDKP